MLKVYRVGDHYAFDFYSVPDKQRKYPGGQGEC